MGKKTESKAVEEMRCPMCGAVVAVEGDISMCKQCGSEVCECCADDHKCDKGL